MCRNSAANISLLGCIFLTQKSLKIGNYTRMAQSQVKVPESVVSLNKATLGNVLCKKLMVEYSLKAENGLRVCVYNA